MTDHQKLLMHFEQERIKDKRFMKQILKNCSEATMAFFDEPYPYIVPMNYGFEWKDTLIFYLHTAPDGHKNQLLRKNNRVALNIHRPPLIRVAPAWKEKIVLIKVTVDQITGKAQYPLDTMEDVEIPPNGMK